MPAHTILSSGTVVVGASADPSDLIEAMRAAARGNRTIRLHAVDSLDTLQRVASICAGYGVVDIIDLHLGGGL